MSKLFFHNGVVNAKKPTPAPAPTPAAPRSFVLNQRTLDMIAQATETAVRSAFTAALANEVAKITAVVADPDVQAFAQRKAAQRAANVYHPKPMPLIYERTSDRPGVIGNDDGSGYGRLQQPAVFDSPAADNGGNVTEIDLGNGLVVYHHPVFGRN